MLAMSGLADIIIICAKIILQPRPQAQPLPLRAVAWVLRGKHSRKRAVGPGRKCRKKCMIQRKSDKIVFYREFRFPVACVGRTCV